MKNKPKIKLYIPRHISFMYTLFALLLVPWTIYLAKTLPNRHIQRHWDITWVGLDIVIMVLLLLTGFFASIKSRLVIIALCVTASFLLVDAWFDITSSRPGEELLQAILLAIFIEVPLSIIGFSLAYKIINKNID